VKDKSTSQLLVALALLLLLHFGGGGLPLVSQKPTAVTYIFEKDDGAVPSEVAAALGKLNTKGILATSFEQNSTNGQGQTPAQYVVPLAAAKEAGLPCLVSTAGEKVLKVVKAPKTEAEVLGIAP